MALEMAHVVAGKPAASSAPPSREPRISQAMSVGRAATLLAAFILLSRLTGFARWMVTSQLYGATPQTDAYSAAFNVPDTLNILIAGGALATGFVPVFTELLARDDVAAARRTFRATLTLLGVAFGGFTLVLFALTWTDWGHHLALVTGQAKPETLDLYLRMLRVLLFAQFLFVMGGVFAGTLNALRLFWYPALQPVAFNGGIIIGGLLGRKIGIESQAWGALGGAFIGTILLQLPAAAANGLPPLPLWDTKDPGVRRVLRQLPPIVFGLASGQIIGLNLPRFFAGSLPNGQLSSLNYANLLMQAPLDLLASGAAIALFPTLSLLAAQKKPDDLREQLAATLRRALLLILGAMALLMALALPLVRLLFEHGKFSGANAQFTSSVLWCYGLCLPGLAAQQFLARGFYSIGETRAPVRLGLGAMALFLAWGTLGTKAHLFGPSFGAQGLALGAAACVTLLAVGLFWTLHGRLGGGDYNWDEGKTARVLSRGLLAAVATYIVAFLVNTGVSQVVAHWDSGHGIKTYIARLAVLGLGAACGGAAFVLAARILGVWSGLKSKAQPALESEPLEATVLEQAAIE